MSKQTDTGANYLILGFVIVAAFWFYLAPHSIFAYDQSTYFILGRSLIDGQGYRVLFIESRPIESYVLPAYPFLIAALMVISQDVIFLKLFNLFFHLATSLIVYKLATHIFDRKTGTFAAVAYALNPVALFLSSLLMTESLFVFALTCAVYVYYLHRDSDKKFLLLGAFSCLALMTRSIGIILIVSFALFYIYRKKYRAILLMTIPLLLLVSPYLMYMYSQGVSPTQDVLMQITNSYSGVKYYALLPMMFGGIILELISVLFLAAVAVFYVKKCHEDKHLPLVIFTILYALALFVWSARDIHYLIPLFPFITIIVSAFFAEYVWKKHAYFFPLLIILLMLGAGFGALKYKSYLDWLEDDFKEFIDMAEYMEDQPYGVVMSRHIDFYLYSGKPLAPYPYSLEEEDLTKIIEEMNVAYFIKDDFQWTETTRKYMGWVEDGSKAGNHCFALFHRIGNTEVYRIKAC